VIPLVVFWPIGYVFLLGTTTISWSNKRQPIVALSTSKAKYMVDCQATKKIVCIQRLLSELGFTQNKPTIIHTNSQGSLALIKNLVHHNKTKHIDI